MKTIKEFTKQDIQDIIAAHLQSHGFDVHNQTFKWKLRIDSDDRHPGPGGPAFDNLSVEVEEKP